jgi:hypothetical protein
MSRTHPPQSAEIPLSHPMEEEEMTTPPPFTDLPVGVGWGFRERLAHRVQETKHRWFAPPYAHLLMRRHRHAVRPLHVRPELRTASIVVILVLKDEAPRVPYFLEHYRRLGVEHFIFIDNGSTDDLQARISGEPDVTLFEAPGDYKAAHFGRDWVNVVLHEHCVGKWVSWLDADEILAFSAAQGSTLQQLRSALIDRGTRSLNVFMLDMYSDTVPSANRVAVGQDPLEVCDYFDRSGYYIVRDFDGPRFWVKGGVRGRLFFSDQHAGPALNKTVMILWQRRSVFLRGAHELWPYGLNGGSRKSGVLLHFKFTAIAASKMLDADVRQQHTEEYAAYDALDAVSFVDPRVSERYVSADSAISVGLFDPLV